MEAEAEEEAAAAEARQKVGRIFLKGRPHRRSSRCRGSEEARTEVLHSVGRRASLWRGEQGLVLARSKAMSAGVGERAGKARRESMGIRVGRWSWLPFLRRRARRRICW